MSCITSLVNPKPWITPEAQLNHIAFSSPLAKIVDETLIFTTDLTTMIALYALDSQFTDWYTSLKKINRLPKQIPEFPNIHQILNKPCPKEICDKTKPDGRSYTVGEKCTLLLVPEELGTVREFEEAVKEYGKTQYRPKENPLQFNFLSSEDSLKDLPFEPTHLILHTNDILENSKNNTIEDLELFVTSLAKKTLENWEVPNFRDLTVWFFLKKIVTGEDFFSERTLGTRSLTYLKPLPDGTIVVVGPFCPKGLCVFKNLFYPLGIGVAALRRL